MRRLAEFPSESGEVILAEVEDLEPTGGTTRRGLSTSAVVERAQTSFEDALENAQPIASGLIGKLRSIADSPDEVQVEFGLSLSASAGAVLVAGASAGAKTILPHVRTKALPESVVYTDEAAVYQKLPDMGYQHDWVSHTNKVYVSGDVHTNTIDGLWTHLKRGVYRGVSPKHLDEYVFRYNNRDNPKGMFNAFLDRVEKASPDSPA